MSTRYSCILALVLFGAAASGTAWADQSGEETLAPGSFFDLDAGMLSKAGGDVLWDGGKLTPVGRAGLYNLGKYGSRAFKMISAKSAAKVTFAAEPIPASALVAGDIFGVRTNQGYYAKVLVTGVNAGSLSLRYTTFAAPVPQVTKAAAGPAAPSITRVQNNYSYILPGLPNYGIAPGSLLVVIGTGLSSSAPPSLQSTAAPGLQTTLNQTSITVKVAGVTTSPALYYTSATQLAAVLPSNTPVGNGTITVSYQGLSSAAVPIQVVASAVGLDTLYGTGNGAAVVTDNSTFAILGLTSSATPGEIVDFWGSGIGADTSNSDTTFPLSPNNLASIPTQVFIGGISANVIYRGRSQYPGLDQYAVQVPANVSTGCFVSAVVVTGTVVSNTVTIPISATAGACTDAVTGMSGTAIQALAGKSGGAVNTVGLALAQVNEGSTSSSVIGLPAVTIASVFGEGYEFASQGSCIVVPPAQGSITNVFQGALDIGTLQLTTPNGKVPVPNGGGFYQAQLSSNLSSTPGTYTFTASGGANVTGFSVALNVGTPLTITNLGSLATITRSQGATLNWSGGFASGTVQLEGEIGNQAGDVRFYCYAPSSAGQITIPPSILMALPAGGGDIIVTNATPLQPITAKGLDVGLAAAIVQTKANAVFK